MTDAADLRNAIAMSLDDDTPRLIYADWLEEHGDAAQAEFIRNQIELAKIDEYHNDYAVRSQREHELIRDHGHRWKIPDLKARQEFHRGFVDFVWIRGDRLFGENRDAIGRTLTVDRLRVSGIDRNFQMLSEIQWLNRIRELDLTNNSFIVFLMSNLFEESSLDQLTSLKLRNVRLWAEDLEHIFPAMRSSFLKSLDLSGNPLGNDGIEALIRINNDLLEELSIRSDGIELSDTIHHQGFIHLANWPQLSMLKHLELTGQNPGEIGLTALFSNSPLSSMERLGLSVKGEFPSSNWIDALETVDMPRLKVLKLGGRFDRDIDAMRFAKAVESKNWIVDMRRFTMSESQSASLAHLPHVFLPEASDE